MRASSAVMPIMLLGFTACTFASVVAFELNEEGSKLYQEGRFTDALNRFLRAQVEQPGLPQLDFNAGAALYQTDELEWGIRETQRALNAELPDLRASAHYNMGNAYFRLDRFQDAYEEYKKTLRDNPGDVDAKVNLELALHRMRQQAQQQPGQSGDQQGNQQPGQPQLGRDQSGSQQNRPGQNSPESGENLRRALQQAGELNIEEALRVLDLLREREARFQQQYNRGQDRVRPAGRPEKDW